MSDRPKVLVSGCYDLLHAGHVRFFESAEEFGDLHVRIGSDENIRRLKGRRPMFNQSERLYMVRALRSVTEAKICAGSGMLDFEPDMVALRPDCFVVNVDGASDQKRALCEKHGVQYVVLDRTPEQGLPARSSTDVKAVLTDEPTDPDTLPFRICLAGGWLDQPWVSQVHPGPVVVVNIHPTLQFNFRSGMATSSREQWKRVAKHDLFDDDPVELARLLFGYENPPGTQYVSGSQDHLGLTLPGINRLYYRGEYWPEKIDSTIDEATCRWLEESLVLVELFERPDGYDPLADQRITVAGVRRLAAAGDLCWEAILDHDIRRLGHALTETHKAWAQILPLTTNDQIETELDRRVCHGRVTSGCGGGYIVMATEEEVADGFRVKIRR